MAGQDWVREEEAAVWIFVCTCAWVAVGVRVTRREREKGGERGRDREGGGERDRDREREGDTHTERERGPRNCRPSWSVGLESERPRPCLTSPPGMQTCSCGFT